MVLEDLCGGLGGLEHGGYGVQGACTDGSRAVGRGRLV